MNRHTHTHTYIYSLCIIWNTPKNVLAYIFASLWIIYEQQNLSDDIHKYARTNRIEGVQDAYEKHLSFMISHYVYTKQHYKKLNTKF